MIALLVGLWVVRESRDEEAHGSFDLSGVALLSGGLFALVWGLIKAGTYGFGDPLPLWSFAAFAVLIAGFIVREMRASHPVLPLRLFRSVSLSAATGLLVLGTFALFGTIFFITLYLQQVHGLSPVAAGVRMLPMTGIFIVSSPLGGALTQRFGPRVPLLLGMVFTAVAMFGLSRIGVDASYNAIWPWFVLIGLAFGFILTAGTEAIVGNAPVQLAGVAGGLQQTAFQIGGVLGTSVLGTILSDPRRRRAHGPPDRSGPARAGRARALGRQGLRRAGRRAGTRRHPGPGGAGDHHRQPPGLHGRLPDVHVRRRRRGPGRRSRRPSRTARRVLGRGHGRDLIPGVRAGGGSARTPSVFVEKSGSTA